MRRKSSLGGRLLIAFLVIAGLPAAMAAIGWLRLGEVAGNQARIVAETIPAIAEVRGFAEESSRVVAVAPELAAVATEGERLQRAAFLRAQVDALSARLDRYEATGSIAPEDLARAVARTREAIRTLDLLVQRRIQAEHDQRRQLDASLAATTELLDIADTLVANAEVSTSAAISNLYEIDETGAGTAARLSALDKLMEVELFQLALMFELRARAAEIGLLLNRIAGAGTADDLSLLEADLARKIEIVARRIRSVQDPSRAGRALALVGAIRPGAIPPPEAANLLETTRGILDLRSRAVAAQADVRMAASSLDAEAAALADRMQAQAASAGAEAAAAIRATRLLYAWGSAAALVMSLAVLWFYVRGNITRRLDNLASGMLRLADGHLGAPVVPRGNDEIARMEGAVEVFRRQAIENRALEDERRRNLAELTRHRTELQLLVAEQTEQLRGEVAAHAEARRRAEAADRAKSEFLAMMSHEIRTPMNGVLGMLRSLSADSLTPRQQSFLRAAQESGQGLMTILNDILDYSKIESGAIRVAESTFSVADTVGDIAWLMAPVAQEKGLDLRQDLADNLPAALKGDVGKLRQILFNLVSNAVKFTERGEVVVSVRPHGPYDGRVSLEFTVRDTGRGISPEAQERIFRVFEQEDAQTARQYGGTGLGLAICRRLAEAMGASLTVESRAGAGAAFTLRAGFVPGRVEDLPAGQPAADRQPPGPPLSVLVVEDNRINQMVVETFLERMGHAATTVENAEAAMRAIARQVFDVVLMDVNLPGLSGTETTRLIRALPDPARRTVPIIGISAHVQQEDVAANLAAGMNEVVAKPVSPERLAEALRHVAGRAADAPPATTLDRAVADLGAVKAAEVARLFLDRLESGLGAVVAATRAGDLRAVSRAAHQLKGAAGNFDLPDLVACLEEIERIARSGDRQALDPPLARLDRLGPAARAGVAGALGRIAGAAVSPAAR